MVTAVSQSTQAKQLPLRLSAFASVKLTILLLVLIAASILIGAWCPQESQVGRDKVFETFGTSFGTQLVKYGISDIFHTPFFLGLIGLLTVNMVACSVQRVFPKVRSLRQPMAFLGHEAIAKLGVSHERRYRVPAEMAMMRLVGQLRKSGYVIQETPEKLTAHWGKVGRLAPTVTHIGLLLLLAGVTVTSWTGFTGFQAVPLNSHLTFEQSEHSKLWIGKLPQWSVHVDATRREDYPTGEAKQWYSMLSVVDSKGRVVKRQEISVNNPLSYDGVDIYQSSWGLGSIIISFNNKRMELPLRQMGPRVNAAIVPLDNDTLMMFSVHGQDEPVRVFAKIPQWPQPRILAALNKGHPADMGNVQVKYEGLVPVTGLQYKSDPGLPITYVAFGFIIIGVMLAAVPHRQVWACVERCPDGSCRVAIGGVSRKAKTAFAKNLDKLMVSLDNEFASAPKEESPCPTFS